MKHTIFVILTAVALGSPLKAQERTVVREFYLSGPYAVAAPAAFDTVDCSAGHSINYNCYNVYFNGCLQTT